MKPVTALQHFFIYWNRLNLKQLKFPTHNKGHTLKAGCLGNSFCYIWLYSVTSVES